MKISNIRLGFATNSSSSHSIVIVPKDGSMYLENDPEWDHFGWDHFVLTSPEMKMKYLAYQVGEWIQHNMGYEFAVPIVKEWYGVELPNKESDFYGVDHQSIITFPLRLEDKQLNLEFVKELEQFLLNDRVVILGGNDNWDYPDNTYPDRIPYELNGAYQPLLARKLSQDWWSIFNEETGAKIRMSFVEFPEELTRANMPELVDMKITDYCPFGCPFCYQDSTTKGIHAPLSVINDYLYALSGSIFEIALGGGEPTLHPSFATILRKCKKYNIVPNFTTKLMPDKWSAEVLQAVKDTDAHFAVSVEYDDEIYELAGFNKIYHIKGNAHFVVGAFYKTVLRDIIAAAQQVGVSVTLLGFKNVGRGQEFKAKPQEIIPELFEHAWRVSVDTAFLEQYAEALKDIPNELKVSGEGTFSMYIDAVNQQAGISSYHVDSFVPCKSDDVELVWNSFGGMK